jgi:hypothetical protein
VSLKDKIAKALALRWLRGRIEGARKKGSVMLKALDGQKRLIVVLGFIVSGFVGLLTGQDVGAYLDLLLRALGWSDPTLIGDAKGLATQVVPLLFAIWAAGSALLKLYQQHKAGATLVELGSSAGVIKAALTDGTLRTMDATPTALSIESSVVVARPVGQWKE